MLLVLDARLVDETRNLEIENKIEKAGKKIIYVINKSDLVDKKYLESIKSEFENCVFMSAKMHLGTNLLRQEIMRLSKGEKVTVGVLGYPNTGKSSVINALSGKGSAKVAPISGYTRALQIIKASNKIYMLDSPGVIPFQEKHELKHLLIGSMNPDKAKDPDLAAEKLLERNKGKLEGCYGIDVTEDDEGYGLLEKVALKLNYMMTGGKPDIIRASIKIIHDWQKGKIV